MSTYYFSPIGNDSTGDGSLGNPWQTLSKAVSSSTTGDTLLADSANGNHAWVLQDFAQSTRNVWSYGGGRAVFDGSGGQASWLNLLNGSFLNLTFQNAISYGFPNGYVFDVTASSLSNPTFMNCIFSGITIEQYQAIFGQGGYGTSSSGVSLVGCLVKNCIAASAFTGIFGTHATVCAFSATDCTLFSDLADADTLNFGVSINGVSATIALINNIIVNVNGTPKDWLDGMTATYTGSNNDILGYTAPPSLTGNISADPLFVDPANGNFNLRPGSPCIDTGTAI